MESKRFLTNTFNKMDYTPVLRDGGLYECDICEQKSLTDIIFCKKCEQILCCTCVHIHNKFNLLKSHNMSNLCNPNLGECNTITTRSPKQCSSKSFAESSVYDYADVHASMQVQTLSSRGKIPFPVIDKTYINKDLHLSAKACNRKCDVDAGLRVKALSSCVNVSCPQIDGVYENDDLNAKGSFRTENQTNTCAHKNAIDMGVVSVYDEVVSAVYEEVDMEVVSAAPNKGY